MAHMLEKARNGDFSFAYNAQNGPPWHKLGTAVDGVMTWTEAIEAASLDWRVELHPTFFYSGMDENHNLIVKEVPDSYAVVRDSDSAVLGTVGARYTPVQNRQAFEFLNMVGGIVKFETAGSLDGGRLVFALAHLDSDFYVGGSDLVKPYLLLGKRHDGRGSMFIKLTAVRVVCWNTLSLAVGLEGERWSMRHVGIHSDADLEAKAEAAQEVLNIAFDKSGDLSTSLKRLAEVEATTSMVDAFMDEMFPLPKKDTSSDKSPRTTKAENARGAFLHSYIHAPGAEEAGETLWGLVNAATFYEAHAKTVRIPDGKKLEKEDPGKYADLVLERRARNVLGVSSGMSWGERALDTALSMVPA